MSIEMIEIEEFNQGTQIKVIGVGGGGGNAVDYMMERGVQGVEFICANTDAQALARSSARRIVQLGTTGLGAGSKPDKARDAAEAATEDIKAAIQGAHMLFITAGMGGGTGTGAAPVIARIAKEMNILTVGVVTKPFDFEGVKRMRNADAGLKELQENVDSLIVVLNEKLLEVFGDDIPQHEAFAHANDVLKNAVGGIAEIINEYGQVNADFEDVRTIMSERGKAMMGTATATGPDRARIAAEQAVTCPLLEGADLKGAKGLLVLVTASRGTLKLKESKDAMNTIKAFATEDANVIYGAAYDDTLGDAIRVTVMATGLTPIQEQAVARAQQPVLEVFQGRRTGTDNMTAGAMPVTASVSMGRASTAPTLVPGMSMGADTSVAPSVWRTNRTQATDKVNALSAGGMDDLDIPAFLRKQAD